MNDEFDPPYLTLTELAFLLTANRCPADHEGPAFRPTRPAAGGPGSPEKVAEMARRYGRREALFHPRDPDEPAMASPHARGRGCYSVRRVKYMGQELPIRAWSLVSGIPPRTLYCRIFLSGWPVDRAMTTPPKRSPAARRTA